MVVLRLYTLEISVEYFENNRNKYVVCMWFSMYIKTYQLIINVIYINNSMWETLSNTFFLCIVSYVYVYIDTYLCYLIILLKYVKLENGVGPKNYLPYRIIELSKYNKTKYYTFLRKNTNMKYFHYNVGFRLWIFSIAWIRLNKMLRQ